MTTSATLHRQLCLIRWLRPPYLYFSKQQLIQKLIDKGFSATSARTFEHDQRCLYNEFGIQIAYNRKQRGYYLVLPDDEDLDDFSAFVYLLERHERLSFLTDSLTSIHDISRFLQLEHNEQFSGAHHLPMLWDALRSGRTVSFRYAPFDAEDSSQHNGQQRLIEPGLLFEYRNRWYLDGFDVQKGQIRTFGLDRISNLSPTDRPVTANRSDFYKTYRQHVIGVTNPMGSQPERVVLRFSATEANYVRSLPLHQSQREIKTIPEYADFELFVILNHELEREILAFGEEVQVLAPALFRQKIRKRLDHTLQHYNL